MKRLALVVLTLGRLALATSAGDFAGFENVEDRLRTRLFDPSTGACVATKETVDKYRAMYNQWRGGTLGGESLGAFLDFKDQLSLKKGFLLGGVVGDFLPASSGLSYLLGTFYAPDPLSAQAPSNHVVNALNFFAWNMLLTELSQRIGGMCTATLRNEALALVQTDEHLVVQECRTRRVVLKQEFAETVAALCGNVNIDAYRTRVADLYETVVSNDLPDGELAPWVEKVSAPAFFNLPASERLVGLMRTLLINPHFLLEH